MQPEDLAALRKQADAIHAGDVHLGRFLHSLIDHLARLDGVQQQEETSPRLKAVAKGDISNAN